MSDEPFNIELHHDGFESNELLRETAELFRWRVGPNGEAERRPPSMLDYKTEWQHNAGTPLGGLPTQMMMMMGNELAPVDRRHFLGTANIIRRNKDYIDDAGPTHESEAWFYTRRILRDAYHLAVQLEDAGKVFQDAMACSGCKETHPAEMFTTMELGMSPHFRNCKGRSGRFRVCNHVSLRWDELSARCRGPRTQKECNHQDHYHESEGWRWNECMPWSEVEPPGPYHWSLPYYAIRFYSRMNLRNDGLNARTIQQWAELLEESDRDTCPHLRLTDFIYSLWSKLEQKKQDDHDRFGLYSGYPPDGNRVEAGDDGVRSYCPHCSCSMRLVQEKSGRPGYPPAYVEVERRVVLPSRPNQQAWLRHLEH